MKVKIGNTIYDSEREPIMIILSQEEKKHIANMTPEATKYCSFPDTMGEDDAKAFMKI